MKYRHQWRKTDQVAKQQCAVCKAVRFGKPGGWGRAGDADTGKPVGVYCDSTFTQ